MMGLVERWPSFLSFICLRDCLLFPFKISQSRDSLKLLKTMEVGSWLKFLPVIIIIMLSLGINSIVPLHYCFIMITPQDQKWLFKAI